MGKLLKEIRITDRITMKAEEFEDEFGMKVILCNVQTMNAGDLPVNMPLDLPKKFKKQGEYTVPDTDITDEDLLNLFHDQFIKLVLTRRV